MFSLFVPLAALAAAAQGQVPDRAMPAGDPATVAAKANLTKVKTAPAMISQGIDALGSEVEALRALGHHGDVVVVGILGADGRFAEPRIGTSSRSRELDALALRAAAASLLSPARDAAGTALPVWISMPFSFKNRAFRKEGGADSYLCSEFVQDMNWWRSAWPDRPWSDHEFYKLMLGMRMVDPLSAARVDQEALRRSIDDFE
ncbi:MAG TPA: TonB family protein, partial [Allosphingosinicella sp.]